METYKPEKHPETKLFSVFWSIMFCFFQECFCDGSFFDKFPAPDIVKSHSEMFCNNPRSRLDTGDFCFTWRRRILTGFFLCCVTDMWFIELTYLKYWSIFLISINKWKIKLYMSTNVHICHNNDENIVNSNADQMRHITKFLKVKSSMIIQNYYFIWELNATPLMICCFEYSISSLFNWCLL